MKYDIEILVPVCRRFRHRIEDFKRYGLINIGGVRVLVTIISSNEDMDGLEDGWPEGVEARVKKYRLSDHVSNIYKFYAEMKPEDMDFKWLMRVDDDSCTDVAGLYDRLEKLYGWEGKFYLGDLNRFSFALEGDEGRLYRDYKHLLGDFEDTAKWMRNEIECGLISRGGMEHMLASERCMNLIRQRAELRGGYGDCVIAIAAALSKLYPVQCPFISHLPKINEFSAFGGHINHIHMIARQCEGHNFQENSRCGGAQYDALTRHIDGNTTEMEDLLEGKRFLMETDKHLTVYEFNAGKMAKIKFDDNSYIWTEYEGSIQMFCNSNEIHRTLNMDESGNLFGKGDDGEEIFLRPI